MFTFFYRSASKSTSSKKSTLNYMNMSEVNNSSMAMSSDTGGESTSTDSDIGSSPSGTTIASPPSSPHQQQQQQPPSTLILNLHRSHNTEVNNINSSSGASRSSHNRFSDGPETPGSGNRSTNLNTAIIRQHSYLNAVQFNDFKLTLSQKPS